jgi:hypothetical protein
MNALKFYAALAIVFISYLGCEQQMPVETEPQVQQIPVEGPGAFGISMLQGLSKLSGTKNETDNSVVLFDLGSIRGSTAFYFILNNVGRCPITDIALLVSDSTYSISPSRIDTLLPGDDIKMLPVIRVVAYHGTPMDGPGTRALLPRGENELTMTVSGTTKTRSGVDTTLYVSANLKLVALVMDFQIHSLLGGPYEVPNKTSSRTELEFPDGSFQNFSSMVQIDQVDSIVTLKNTGNVPLNCKIYESDNTKWNLYVTTMQDSLICIVEPGDSLLIPHKCISGYSHNMEHFFFIDGNHAACEAGKWPMGSDGIIRFSILQSVL